MKYALFFSILTFGLVHSQNDSINKLDEIVLHGNFSPVVNSGYQVVVFSDSVLNHQYESLGTLLQKQANFYFKQNGNGMVSSISLRGTTASQTGVYWNGIAINSALNGQTDFNTLDANGFDELEIRKGGGSVLFGNGAIGGAINLKDKVVFHDLTKVEIGVGAGSYDTYTADLKGVWATKDLYGKIALGGQRSVNDYPYQGTDLKNDNGEFSNYSVNATLGYKINEMNSLTFNGSIFDNDRDLSGTLTSVSNSNLKNTDRRMLLTWTYLGQHITSTLKTAFLHEDFSYLFDKKSNQNESFGDNKRIIGKYDVSYFLNSHMFFKAGLELQHAKGEGSSISEVSQDDLTGYLLMHHQPFERFMYNASFRYGASSAYRIPFIYSIDARYSISNQLSVRSGFSTNYRLPTFNDLYWVPGGNPDLKPENSKSAEIGLNFNKGNLAVAGTVFMIKSTDLIQWVPVSQDYWEPRNVNKATNYGLEISGSYQRSFGAHYIMFDLSYDFTRAIDEETDKQMIYVPENKARALIDYQWKKWRFNYNLQYMGSVFVTTSNSQQLDPYWLSDLGIYRNLWGNKVDVGLQINNVFDVNYQSVAYRPMPNRNFLIQFNFKI